jgi:hypothetical protein
MADLRAPELADSPSHRPTAQESRCWSNESLHLHRCSRAAAASRFLCGIERRA